MAKGVTHGKAAEKEMRSMERQAADQRSDRKSGGKEGGKNDRVVVAAKPAKRK